jgi:hypothetical protein
MNKSESIKEIATAMLKVQEEIKGMTPDAKNPFFKSSYITLDGILEYIRPILTKNQIWLVQEAKGLDTNVSVRTSLIHSSGEFMETESLEMIPSKNDPQVLGSLITYLKRYQLAALMGISSEVDDDGNKASGKNGSKTDLKGDTGAQLQGNTNTQLITDGQVQRLFAIAKGNTKAAKEVLLKHGYTESKAVKKADYETICEEIQKVVS